MIDGLSIAPIQVGAGGLVALIVILVLTGRLVPRNMHREAVQREADEATKWHEAWELSEEIRREVADQNRQLLSLGETTVDLLRSLTRGREPPT